MSSFIAVCVTFLGLTLIIVNVAVFLQMLLSFPAMLSSNSQAYVQQQRKLHHIPSSPQEDLDESYAIAAEDDGEDEQEWETTGGKWNDEEAVEDEDEDHDDVEEVEEEDEQYQADDCSSEACVTTPPKTVAVAVAARRSDSMTRGRPLRRQRRRYIARTVLRVKDIGRVRDSDYESEFSETERRPVAGGARSRDRGGRAGHDCRGGWRGMDWTR